MGRAESHASDHKPTQLKVIVDAMNLHAHTCRIMSNAKVFNPAEDFNSMTLVHIFETTLEIYTRLYEANSIRVGDDPLLARERRLRRLTHKERRGEAAPGSVEESYRCVRACMTKGNSARLLRRMDDFVNELKKEIDNAKDKTI